MGADAVAERVAALSVDLAPQMTIMLPIEFRPLLKRIRWGGRRLGTVLGKAIGPETDYAESWEISDHGDDQSVVLDGPCAGWSLARLVAERDDELFGRHAGREQFPLLVKFLDAHDRLSVQVHPDDAQAKRYDPCENGKTEAWVIVDADPGAVLYAGLKSGVGRDALADAIAAGRLEECLHRFTVRPGDCVFVPAGTVHAIGEGILLAEIQQSSDLTFRLYDWNRLGTDGKPRELHVARSLECIDFDRGSVDPVEPEPIRIGGHACERLVRCDHFVIRRHATSDPFTLPTDDRFHVLMTLGGAADLACGDARRRVELGRTILVPAAAHDLEIIPDGTVTLLEAFLP